MGDEYVKYGQDQEGMAVPGELALAGFDDTEPAGWPDISLTSYAQPAAEMARSTAEAVMAMLDRPGEPARRQVVPGWLMVRNSSAPAPPNMGLLGGAAGPTNPEKNP